MHGHAARLATFSRSLRLLFGWRRALAWGGPGVIRPKGQYMKHERDAQYQDMSLPVLEPKARVLVVHDNPAKLLRYWAAFRKLGHEVYPCVSYKDGRSCLRGAEWDFVVVSQGDSRFAGRCILECAKEISLQAPILVVSRQYDESCCIAARDLDAIDYLQEPVAAEVLARLVAVQKHPGLFSSTLNGTHLASEGSR